MRPIHVATIAAAALALSACSTAHSADTAQLRVVASTSILADVVANVGGEHAEVTPLIGPGVDPHTYEPSLHLSLIHI